MTKCWRVIGIAGLLSVACAGLLEAQDDSAFRLGLDAYMAGRHDQAFAHWRPLAEQGDRVAQFNLGVLYARGLGVSRDMAQAITWYTRAANAGYAPAQFNLGSAYVEGTGVTADKQRAAEWWSKAAAQDYPHALFNLATLYLRGDGVEEDRERARELYRRAAALGDDRAQRALEKFATGKLTVDPAPRQAARGTPQRTGASAEPPERHSSGAPEGAGGPDPGQDWLARQPVQHLTIQVFAFGDANAARKFTRQHGLTDEIVLLRTESKGRTWYKGILGSYADRNAAKESLAALRQRLPGQAPWIRPIADLRKEAPSVLSQSDYTESNPASKGRDATSSEPPKVPDVPQRTPAKPVVTGAEGAPVDDAERMRRGQAAFNSQDYTGALALWQPLAEKGVADAQYGLAFMYESGWGVEKNEQKAFEWYKTAAERGHVKSQFNLGLLYLNGRGVARNEGLGWYWIQTAADRDDARARDFLRAAAQGQTKSE